MRYAKREKKNVQVHREKNGVCIRSSSLKIGSIVFEKIFFLRKVKNFFEAN